MTHIERILRVEEARQTFRILKPPQASDESRRQAHVFPNRGAFALSRMSSDRLKSPEEGASGQGARIRTEPVQADCGLASTVRYVKNGRKRFSKRLVVGVFLPGSA